MFCGLSWNRKNDNCIFNCEALGRPIARIPFGGMGDPLDLRGQSRLHPEAEPEKLLKLCEILKVEIL